MHFSDFNDGFEQRARCLQCVPVCLRKLTQLLVPKGNVSPKNSKFWGPLTNFSPTPGPSLRL